MTASRKLQDLIEEWSMQHMTASKLVDQIIEQATEENISNEELRTLVETALARRGLKERQARALIPPELKRVYWKDVKITTSAKTADVPKPIPKAEPQPKIIHKTSDEINIPQAKPTIIDAETITDEEMTTEIEAVPPSRQRVSMPKKMLGKLYAIAGRYAKPFDFVLIIEDGKVVDVEDQPLLEVAN